MSDPKKMQICGTDDRAELPKLISIVFYVSPNLRVELINPIHPTNLHFIVLYTLKSIFDLIIDKLYID